MQFLLHCVDRGLWCLNTLAFDPAGEMEFIFLKFGSGVHLSSHCWDHVAPRRKCDDRVAVARLVGGTYRRRDIWFRDENAFCAPIATSQPLALPHFRMGPSHCVWAATAAVALPSFVVDYHRRRNLLGRLYLLGR